MKILQLTNNTAFLFFLLLFVGCIEEPCLDIAELDRQSSLTKGWFVSDSIGNQKITDKNRISQTFIIRSRHYTSYDDAVEDDCGNIYGSFYFSIQYSTSLSSLHFMVDIHGSGLSEDGFYLKMTITDTGTSTNTARHKSATYDFVTETCREDNATIQIREQIHTSNKNYNDVLEISFNHTYSPNDIKTVYYAKGYGIIKFIDESGNTFEVNESSLTLNATLPIAHP